MSYSTMDKCVNAVRGVIVAPRGKKLVVADLSNIEGRKLAWLAGENWKLAAFATFDTCLGKDGNWHTGSALREAALRGEPIPLELDAKGEPVRLGPDLYKLAYAKAFGIKPEDVDKELRQIGKVMELMLGYQGGVGAFLTGAATYGFDIEAMAAAAIDGIPPDTLAEAREFLAWQTKQGRGQYGLSDTAFLVCESFKRLWRDAHPATASWWPELEEACIAAVQSPGQKMTCRRHVIRRDGEWLRIRLPSGRYLCYPSPRADGGKLTYMGINQYSRKWERLKTYGGKLAENITQAAARDVLAYSMPRIDGLTWVPHGNAPEPYFNEETGEWEQSVGVWELRDEDGYLIALSVHDEIITETPDRPEYNATHLAALMSTVPPWAEGLPLAAAGFEARRYRKD